MIPPPNPLLKTGGGVNTPEIRRELRERLSSPCPLRRGTFPQLSLLKYMFHSTRATGTHYKTNSHACYETESISQVHKLTTHCLSVQRVGVGALDLGSPRNQFGMCHLILLPRKLSGCPPHRRNNKIIQVAIPKSHHYASYKLAITTTTSCAVAKLAV